MPRAWVWVVVALTLGLWLTGCVGDAGTGGTGEYVVPRATLRDIDGTNVTTFSTAATQPAPWIPTTMQAATQPVAEVEMTIEEARAAALANNLDIRVSLIRPEIDRLQLDAERAAFEATFVANASYGSQDSPGFIGSDVNQLAGNQSKSFGVTPGLVQPLPTGGAIRANLPMDRFEPGNNDPTYQTDFSASLTHQLLRGAGTYYNTQGIRVAFYGYQRSQAQAKLEIIGVLTNVDRLYWALYDARQNLDVARQNYDFNVTQLERARRQVRTGAAAEVEIARADSGVADAAEVLVNAAADLTTRTRAFKRAVNVPGLEMHTPTRVVPVSKPNAAFYALDRAKLVQSALDKRMEMLTAELSILSAAANSKFVRNSLLPFLSVDYSYNVNGLGPSFNDSFKVLGDKDFEDHRVGLRLEIPIGNNEARSRYRATLAQRMEAIASKELRAQLVTSDTLATADALEINYQLMLSAQARVISNARLVDQEVRQFNLGLRTTTDVVQAQNRLSSARFSEVRALTTYQLAQVDIAFATGMILGAAKVTWEPTPAPRK